MFRPRTITRSEVESFYRQALLQTERRLFAARINDILEVEDRVDCGNLAECLGRLYEDFDAMMAMMSLPETEAPQPPIGEPEG